jgi:hypothetical protein
LSFKLGGAAPFSSYVYNHDLTSNIPMDWTQGRAYFDTIFLSRIAETSKVMWINEPLVNIRCHDRRISTDCGVRDYKAFIKLVECRFKDGLANVDIIEYRYVHLYFYLKQRNYYPVPALKYLARYFIFLIVSSESFRARFIKYLCSRITFN